MLDEYDDDEYWGMFPPEHEYPPTIPAELTVCLGNVPKMTVECDRLKGTLNKALEKIRLTRRALDEWDSLAPQALSTPEVLSTEEAESDPAIRQ